MGKKAVCGYPDAKKISVYSYKIINEFDHDETSFTEGMTIEDAVLYENAGLWDQSRLMAIDIWTGGIQRRLDLAPLHFAEGITVLVDEIYQLTYQSCTSGLCIKKIISSSREPLIFSTRAGASQTMDLSGYRCRDRLDRYERD